jgi:hypothetical protein
VGNEIYINTYIMYIYEKYGGNVGAGEIPAGRCRRPRAVDEMSVMQTRPAIIRVFNGY